MVSDKVSPQLDEGVQMRNYRTLFVCFLAALLAVFVAGCGQETVTLPGVASVTPAQGATGVAITSPVTTRSFFSGSFHTATSLRPVTNR